MSRPDRYLALLLRLLPASFRQRHGEELLALWEQMRSELGRRPGLLRLLRFYSAVTWDVVSPARALQPAGRPSGAGWSNGLGADARFALRQYRRRWGTTVTMLGVLSVGMAITVILCSVVHSYAVRTPPGVPTADDLVRIRGSQLTQRGLGGRYFEYEEVQGYRGLTGHFDAVAGWAEAQASLDVPGDEERRALPARLAFVTSDYFRVLGVRPVVGTGLPDPDPDDPALSTVAVIGYRMWDQLLGQDPEVIGRTLTVNDVSLTVVGVAPPLFQGISGNVELWFPLISRGTLLPPSTAEALRFGAVARLRPGVSLEAATAATQVVIARAAASARYAGMEEDRELGAEVVRTLNGDPYFERDVRRLSLAVGGLGVLVLLITCTNVSALLLGLAMARRHEIVVRLSLGATRGRVMRQLLTESTLIALVAGGASVGLAAFVFRLVTTHVRLPIQIGITWPAAAFTLVTALAVGLLFGLAPALHATRLAVATALQDSATAITGTRLRLQRGLVVTQVALTQPLVVAVVAAVLFVHSELRPAGPLELGDRLVSVLLARISNDPWSVDPGDIERRHATEIRRLRADLESTPGIQGVVPAPVSIGELGPYEAHRDDRVGGAEYVSVAATGFTAAPAYFSTIGVPLLRGRDFVPGDVDVSQLGAAGAVVPVVIPEEMARRLWSDVDPLGRRLTPVVESTRGAATLVVAGVIPTPDRGGRYAGESQIFFARDTTEAPRGLTVRTVADARPLLPTIRSLAADAAPSAVAVVRTFSDMREEFSTMFRRVTGGLLASAVLTLLLSAIGLYAVVAFGVGQRRGEIAVRIAIGARAQRVARQVLGSGMRLASLGLVIGLPVSLLAVRFWNSLPDPDVPEVPLGAVAVVAALMVVVTALLASFIPARRAAAVDPSQVLRSG